MSHEIADFERAWLAEIQRRQETGEPIDARKMMVHLRDTLPIGFTPSKINHQLLDGRQLSVEGVRALGDPTGLIPDIDRTVHLVRERLIANPALEQIRAAEIAEGLQVNQRRAETLLALLGSLGSFWQSAQGSEHGYSWIGIGSEEILARYLWFTSVEDLLRRKSESVTPTVPIQRRNDATHAVTPKSVFVLMSMDPQDAALQDILRTIKRVCAAFGLQAHRIDDIQHQERITDRILKQIDQSEFIVADLSGERPNVYYEVGYAHARGKWPILLRKQGTRLHFDLSVHNVPEYRNITELEEILDKRFEAMLGRTRSITAA
jgi:nucleoside 2-deoxyribosyltransferase